MEISAIYHRSRSEYAFPLDERRMVFRLKAREDDLEEAVLLYGDTAYPAKEVPLSEAVMERAVSYGGADYFEITIEPGYERIVYAFLLKDRAGKSLYYYGDGFHEMLAKERNDLFKFPYNLRGLSGQGPTWLSRTRFYNVFPDSFAANPNEGVCLKEGEEAPRVLYGGTLRDILSKLDYIESLGCNGLYLNPIFKAKSYHRYDTEDYLQIDPHLGTEDDLRNLIDECHKRGMRVMLDGVYNHCGPSFFAFRDLLENQENSPYKDWFYKVRFPVHYPPLQERDLDYAAFGYEKDMPKLDCDSPGVREYLSKAARKWIGEFKADGFRMDTADEVSPSFWAHFRSLLREINPEAAMIAEIWQNPHGLVGASMFDGYMNYDFRRAVLAYLGTCNSRLFLEKAGYLEMRLPKRERNGQLNLLSTHDVPRTLSILNGDEGLYALSFVLFYSWSGPLTLFYGDECLFKGIEECEYRRPMEFMDEPPLKALLSSLAKIREEHPALSEGDYRPVYGESGGLLGFKKISGDDKVTIWINASDSERRIAVGKTLLYARGLAGNELSPKGFALFGD